MVDTGAATPAPRVLIVEDELSIRELLRFHLGLAGFQVEEVGDGRRALERARESAFDLLILDVMLPGWMASPYAARSARRGRTSTRQR
jgi:DNA-binding response OmpR family regulator